MRFDLLTLFPEMFESVFSESILKRAQEKNCVEYHLHNIRDFSENKHHKVDDTPYGGGAGMVMMPDPLVKAVESLPKMEKRKVILLSPRGKQLTQAKANELSSFDQLVLICGRYEGVDERAIKLVVDEEISLGDFILSGGEIPAMALVDAVTRLIPGVLGNIASVEEESFSSGLLEHPHYTKPREYRGLLVPDVLLEGDHKKIEVWRRKESLRKTWKNRKDLLSGQQLSEEEKSLLKALETKKKNQ